jgi:hypothetical protein
MTIKPVLRDPRLPRILFCSGVGAIALWAMAVAAAEPGPPPSGAWSGTITKTVSQQHDRMVRVTVTLDGAGAGQVQYGSPVNCTLSLEYVGSNAKGHDYAFSPLKNGSSGMGGLCDELLAGDALVTEDGAGLQYTPFDSHGAPREAARLTRGRPALPTPRN